MDAFLASSFGIGIDNVMHFYKFENTKEEEELLTRFKLHCYFHHTIHPYTFKSDEYLHSKFQKDFYSGITLTAPGFYAPQEEKLIFRSRKKSFMRILKVLKLQVIALLILKWKQQRCMVFRNYWDINVYR